MKHRFIGDLTRAELRDLESILGDNYVALSRVLNWIRECYDDIPVREVSAFLLCICSKSPVCSFIPPSVVTFDLLKEICLVDVKSKPAVLLKVREHLPLVYNMLSALPYSNFPLVWQELFEWLYHIAINPFPEENFVSGPDVVEHDEQLSFFPTLPKCRERGCFELDRQTQIKEDICTKKSHGHPTLTPGIFTIYCPHGENLFVSFYFLQMLHRYAK